MPLATRAIALQEAVKVTAGNGESIDVVLSIADKFHVFIMRDELAAASPQMASTPAAEPPAKPPKAPKGELKKPPAKSEEEVVAEAQAKARAKVEAADAAEEGGPTKQDVGDAAAALLKANKRAELISLFQVHGATSVSTLPEEDYALFIKAAKALVAKGAETSLLD